MITTQQFIEKLAKSDLLKSIEYSHPVLFFDLLDHSFNDDFEENVEVLAKRTKLPIEDVVQAALRPLISLRFHQELSAIPNKRYTLADNWLALSQGLDLVNKDNETSSVRAIHFYGYKGGQARSTTLAVAAKRLADLGRRILVVDADIEAPSLHLLFGSAIPRLSGSLMGVCENASDIKPVAAYSGKAGGHIDLLGCRPSADEYDLDFLAFAMTTAIDPAVLRRGFTRLKEYVATNRRWDVVFIDHRTGISPSVVPTLSAWPGSVVMALRPDLLSTPALKIAKSLFSAFPAFPGAYVSFSLDPEEKKDQFSIRAEKIKAQFLEVLAQAIEKGGESSDEIDPQVLNENFVEWYFDRAFLEDQSPDFEQLSKDNQNALSDLIQVLGLDEQISKSLETTSGIVDPRYASRAPSGATDAGWFIETKDISTLMQESSAYSYVFGRKGTGKTRIYREMHKRNKGTPLLAAADYQHEGIRAQSPEAHALLESVHGDFEAFWWKLIGISIARDINANAHHLSTREVYANARQLEETATLLIDGVETAVSSRDTKRFVESLFRVLSTVQNDPSINEKIQFKLFIRPDLSVGIQNVEQQIAGRKFDLRWEEAAIFNYMLAEIERKFWFRSKFGEVCSEIADRREQIIEGRLKRSEYERLLLGIFPQKLRRNNLLTMTFLRTYFSDAVSESTDKKSSFYPRVVGAFLEHVERRCAAEPARALDNTGRVTHTIIVDSFTEATEEFISEIKQELYFALDLDVDPDANRRLVDDLMSALSGLQTPFSLDECVDKLIARMGSQALNQRVLRDALRQMRDMGIFEPHPVDPTKWRAGRLFKEALKMKYVR